MRFLFFAVLVSAASALFIVPTSAHMGAKGVVKERMEMMKSMGAAMKALGKMTRGQGKIDAAQAASAAGTVARHGPRISSMFPAGSGGGASEASPDIWRDPKGFREHADALVAASEKLHAAAKANDLPAIRSSFRTVGKTCSGCHKKYRVKKKH